jgi:hypothetical protein
MIGARIDASGEDTDKVIQGSNRHDQVDPGLLLQVCGAAQSKSSIESEPYQVVSWTARKKPEPPVYHYNFASENGTNSSPLAFVTLSAARLYASLPCNLRIYSYNFG